MMKKKRPACHLNTARDLARAAAQLIARPAPSTTGMTSHFPFTMPMKAIAQTASP
ncbi:MAG: hypothetical protein M3463_18410 [Verrucomicrobiota bacterium]|nr:hypothetical protein [Verrucomicrobiota bacterium]